MIGTIGFVRESLAEASSTWLIVLVDAALKGLIVLLVAAVATKLMRRASKLETRMLAILDRSRNRRTVTRVVAGAVVVCLLGLTVPLAMLHEASVGAPAEASAQVDSNARKEKAKKFVHLLQEREFRTAVGLFDSRMWNSRTPAVSFLVVPDQGG